MYRFVRAALAAAVLSQSADAANAGQYRFTKVAEATHVNEFVGRPSINDHGVVAFAASLSPAGRRGIYTFDGQSQSTYYEDDAGGFIGDPIINDRGEVFFAAVLPVHGRGIFRANGTGGVTKLATIQRILANSSPIAVNDHG